MACVVVQFARVRGISNGILYKNGDVLFAVCVVFFVYADDSCLYFYAVTLKFCAFCGKIYARKEEDESADKQ